MKKIIKFGLVVLLTFLFVIPLSQTAQAQESDFKVLELQKLSVDLKHYYTTGYHENLHKPPAYSLDAHIDLNVAKYGYLNNTIHSMGTEDQFRLIGLNVNLGVHVTPWLDVGIEHWSKHYLDGKGPWDASFPRYDSINLRLNLYNKTPTANTLLKDNFIPNF